MLESYLCRICQRSCNEPERAKCLTNPSLNVGSGLMLIPSAINFDSQSHTVREQSTDIIGRIEDIRRIFKPNTIAHIFCSHVIEHLYPEDAVKFLQDCFDILRPKGALLLEGPDIINICGLYESFGPKQLIQEIYGNPQHRKNWGEDWVHRWGWTGNLLADAMTKTDFTDIEVGKGISHHHPERDYRVKGIKPNINKKEEKCDT